MTHSGVSYTIHLRVRVGAPDLPWGDVALAVEQALLDSTPVAGTLRHRFEVVEAEADTAEDL
jgi:hypothetical protein